MKSLQNFKVFYSTGFDLVLDHLLPLACVFNGFRVHVCLSTNSTVSGQDYPGVALMIFRLIAKYTAVLNGSVYFRFKEKDLDPLIKYYNNQTNKQIGR